MWMFHKLKSIGAYITLSIVALVIGLTSTVASAANITYVGHGIIYIEGMIKSNDYAVFKNVVETTNAKKVFLNSDGGVLIDGIQIGSLVKTKKLDTVIIPNVMCASACVLISVNGNKKYMYETSTLGLHEAVAVKLDEKGNCEVDEQKRCIIIPDDTVTKLLNITVVHIFGELQLPLGYAYMWMLTPHDKISIINKDNNKTIGNVYTILKDINYKGFS